MKTEDTISPEYWDDNKHLITYDDLLARVVGLMIISSTSSQKLFAAGVIIDAVRVYDKIVAEQTK